MVHIILTSHGGFAEGLVQSIEMLIGAQDHLECVTFGEDMGMDELDEIFSEKIKDASADNQYLIFCDIKGGTPFNVASRYSFKNDNVSVIYGMNLPLLITALMETQSGEGGLEELTESLQKQMGEMMGVSEL
nr:PTS sugar transporter subunit IIA [uncultured Merdimonas sp.]